MKKMLIALGIVCLMSSWLSAIAEENINPSCKCGCVECKCEKECKCTKDNACKCENCAGLSKDAKKEAK